MVREGIEYLLTGTADMSYQVNDGIYFRRYLGQ